MHLFSAVISIRPATAQTSKSIFRLCSCKAFRLGTQTEIAFRLSASSFKSRTFYGNTDNFSLTFKYLLSLCWAEVELHTWMIAWSASRIASKVSSDNVFFFGSESEPDSYILRDCGPAFDQSSEGMYIPFQKGRKTNLTLKPIFTRSLKIPIFCSSPWNSQGLISAAKIYAAPGRELFLHILFAPTLYTFQAAYDTASDIFYIFHSFSLHFRIMRFHMRFLS